MEKICSITTTRAEYGLQRRLLERIKLSRDLELQLIVSGAHLSNEFGYTIDELEQDGFRATKDALGSDTITGTVKTLGVALMGFAEAFEDLKPDMLLLVGDRYELMAPATALIHNIPIAHIHGGELTFGAVDDAVRHSLTNYRICILYLQVNTRNALSSLESNQNLSLMLALLG